jgi:ABC-2 type transport system ATP-binding protein
MEKLISVKNLRKVFRSHKKSKNLLTDFFNRQYVESTAVKNISFEVGEGELIGFIGPNGAGKTTTLKMLSGILYPTSGEVQVLGHTPFNKEAQYLRQIAFVMGQKNQLLWELPAIDSFRLNKVIYELTDEEYERNLGELTEILEIKDLVDKPVRTLSLGQRMRVELVAALLHRPKVLFLDEPTIGLDVFAQAKIINFVRTYQERTKATVILTSHYMKDIQSLAKRVIVLSYGEIIFDGPLKDLIDKYSTEKSLQIVLKKKLSPEEEKSISLPYEYLDPVLKVKGEKKKLLHFMQKFLDTHEFSDFTLEDEAIEEVIKKVFKH